MTPQTKTILKHLATGQEITPLEALNKYGCFRLAARIAELRADDYNIKTEYKTENGKRFASYKLIYK